MTTLKDNVGTPNDDRVLDILVQQLPCMESVKLILEHIAAGPLANFSITPPESEVKSDPLAGMLTQHLAPLGLNPIRAHDLRGEEIVKLHRRNVGVLEFGRCAHGAATHVTFTIPETNPRIGKVREMFAQYGIVNEVVPLRSPAELLDIYLRFQAIPTAAEQALHNLKVKNLF